MPWVQKTTHAGKCIYIQRHYSSRYGSKNKCTRGSNYGKTSEAQAAEWLKAQRQTGAAWVELAKELREVAAEVSSAAQSARSASRGWHWKLWLTVMLASMMPTVVLLIASLLLLDLTPLTTEDGSIWLRLVAR